MSELSDFVESCKDIPDDATGFLHSLLGDLQVLDGSTKNPLVIDKLQKWITSSFAEMLVRNESGQMAVLDLSEIADGKILVVNNNKLEFQDNKVLSDIPETDLVLDDVCDCIEYIISLCSYVGPGGATWYKAQRTPVSCIPAVRFPTEVESITSNTDIVSDDNYKVFNSLGAYTFNVPDGLPVGFTFEIINATANINTINLDTESFQGPSATTATIYERITATKVSSILWSTALYGG